MSDLVIDGQEFTGALELNMPEIKHVFDRETGEIIMMPDNGSDFEIEDELLELIEDNWGTRFIKIEPLSSREGWEIMSDFIDQLSDTEAVRRLSRAIQGKSAFRRFKDELMDFPELRERWFLFHEEALYKHAEAWLESHEIKATLTRRESVPPKPAPSPRRKPVKNIFDTGKWLNRPKSCAVTKDAVTIITDPGTDFWQRSYYGFRHDNAPALLFTADDNFTFTVQVSFAYRTQFDQAGVIIYLDSDNWFKASIEYENATLARLGSVVTNRGYSDWATTDIATPTRMWYRFSRRGPDFLIESSTAGTDFKQMRVFHLHALGETTPEMGKRNPPAPATQPIDFGLYACSPLQSSFEARFDHMKFESCLWLAHTT